MIGEITEVYSELCQTSKMERFAKIVNGCVAVNYFLQNAPS